VSGHHGTIIAGLTAGASCLGRNGSGTTGQMGRDTSTEAARQLLQLDSARVIADVTRRFAEVTTDYALLLESVARALAESLHDSCSVLLLTADGESMTTSSVHAVDADVLAELRRSFADRDLSLAKQPGLRHLLDTGQGVVIPRLSQQANPTEEQRHWQDRIGLHSTLVVPVRVQGRSIGVLTLGRFRPQSPPFQQSDLVLAQTLADHAGLAIENARLFVAAEDARRGAELAHSAMRESEAAHRLFFDSNPNASYIVDAESLQVLAANDAALQLYGYTRAEFMQLALFDLRYPEDQQRLAEILHKAGSGVTSGLARHRRKDGSVIHVEGGSHLSTFEGRPARLVVLSDQTKRVQAEAQRDESERRLHRTLDDMREGYTIMGHDLRYLYMNRAGAEQTHLPREQLIGRTPLELYPGFEGSKIHQALQVAAEQRVPQRVEEEFLHADGEVGYFELNIQPIPEGLSVLSIDQTERRRAENRRDSLEEQLRQAQKLEAIGRLAGGVAHDFNNVLSVILGYSEDLLQTLEQSDPRWQDMKEIESAANRAAALTRQLLMFSRQQVLEPKVLDLNEVLSQMDRMLARILGEQVELSVLPAARLGRVRADRGNLEQVIVNLAINARDAMPEGGRLTLETANVVADEAFVRQHLGCQPGSYVRLAVTDTGTGMDAATRGRIFEPFFSTKAHGKGTGLGLSTVFGIVQQSGGGVWVYSEPGHGTTFKVYLPRVDAELDTPEQALVSAQLDGTETILLVEDEPAVREVARRILERHGYQVLVAESPDAALLLAEARRDVIHLLVTDVVMPRLSGSQLARQLLRHRPALKVLYVSGYTDGSIDSHGVLEPGVSFLQKPFTSDSLAGKVRSMLNGDSVMPPSAVLPHT
jgi:two-component system, cell cycle sensor histidine kinase and response regulator CckA